MPTQQEIDNLHTALMGSANAIETESGTLAFQITVLSENTESIDLKEANLLLGVLQERFEINNQLVYTNESERRAALAQAKASDAGYQNLLLSQRNYQSGKRNSEANIELERKKYRANELLLLYHANNPA